LRIRPDGSLPKNSVMLILYLSLQMHGYGTNLEGPWSAVMKAIGDCHQAVHDVSFLLLQSFSSLQALLSILQPIILLTKRACCLSESLYPCLWVFFPPASPLRSLFPEG
jgi:hypothetical protein